MVGLPPFLSPVMDETLNAHVRVRPLPPSQLRPEVGPAIDALVLRALEKDPKNRFDSADGFRRSLERAQKQRPGQNLTHVVHRAQASVDEGLVNYAASQADSGWFSPTRKFAVGASVIALVVAAAGVGLALTARTPRSPEPGASVEVEQSVAPSPSPSQSSTVRVPPLAGMTNIEAEAAIARSGLTYSMQTFQDSALATDTVLGSSPPAGALVGRGTLIHLMVASGFNVVPDVTNMSEAAAGQVIRSNCFVPIVRQLTVLNEGQVSLISSLPTAGSRLACGSTVTVTILAKTDAGAPSPAPAGTPTPTLITPTPAP